MNLRADRPHRLGCGLVGKALLVGIGQFAAIAVGDTTALDTCCRTAGGLTILRTGWSSGKKNSVMLRLAAEENGPLIAFRCCV
jgi:hypothetical protein